MAKQHREDILMTGRLVTHPTQRKVQKRAGVGGREERAQTMRRVRVAYGCARSASSREKKVRKVADAERERCTESRVGPGLVNERAGIKQVDPGFIFGAMRAE